MAQWGNTDNAANSVLWAVGQYKSTVNTTTQTAFFGNTTANAYIDGITVGQYGVDTDEQTAARASGAARPAHAGWIVKTEGQGGRAGRVSYEVLVAGGSLTGDFEDSTFPDTFISITTQPSDTSANTDASEQATFTVVATSEPSKTLGYVWTYANGDNIQAGANVGVTTGATLTIDSSVENVNSNFKVTVTADGAVNAVSSNATLTITTT